MCVRLHTHTRGSLCVHKCVCKNVCPRLILLPLFPLRISCIIYEALMNMLISRRAGRGERASPVLFLHSSDEREGKREQDREEGAGGENNSLHRCRGESLSEKKGKKTKGREGKYWKKSVEIHLLNPQRSTNRYCGNMDGGKLMLCYIVLETNESPMLSGRGEVRLEEAAREMWRLGGEYSHCSFSISVVFLSLTRQVGK